MAAGESCDDGDDRTYGDQYNTSCVCAGTRLSG